MNKRIKKLLNEATSGHEQEHDRSKVMTVSDKEMDKFAELIVQECISVMKSTVDESIDFERKLDETSSWIESDIKKHFGVAESSAQAEQEAAAFIAAEDKKVASRYGYFPKLHPSEWKD
jgi:hypothetical protein